MDESALRILERSEGRYWGKYRGLVVDRDDPEQLGRIRARVPSVFGEVVTGWAWPVAPYSGDRIGFFFIPQVGDLVWIEFAEGDLDHPIWSGGGWARPGGTLEIPPDARTSYPDRCVITTRSGSTIVFDDAAETVTVRSPGRCEILLDESADTVTVRATTVVIRASGGEEELVTRSWVEQVFANHIHPSGVGPTGPPQPLPPIPHPFTTVLKAE
jgi:uncharacterized protein involved in type VI secretion and phage assembly